VDLCADHQAYDDYCLKERGYQVPKDISVTLRRHFTPARRTWLETMRVPYYEIGFAGSRRLFDKKTSVLTPRRKFSSTAVAGRGDGGTTPSLNQVCINVRLTK